MSCTVTLNLEIVPGTRADYESLSHYHYRESHLGPYAAIYAMKQKPPLVSSKRPRYPGRVDFAKGFVAPKGSRVLTAGVIVYAMPASGCQARTGAMPFLSGLDRGTRLKLVNKNIRTISRVIIEPRFRSLGLAQRMVRETMPLMNVPFVEALAVMGRVNPFFEKAGMTRLDTPPVPKGRGLSPGNPLDFSGPPSTACVRLIEAFSVVGIDERDLIDAQLVQEKLDNISPDRSNFIEQEIVLFLQSYGNRRLMQPGIERTRFIVSKLTDRPVYYLWKNPVVELKI